MALLRQVPYSLIAQLGGSMLNSKLPPFEWDSGDKLQHVICSFTITNCTLPSCQGGQVSLFFDLSPRPLGLVALIHSW